MKLFVENVGKICNAEIEFNGITVIAGENNTGKSTISKILYSLFNSNYKSMENIAKQKQSRLCREIIKCFRSNLSENNEYTYRFSINRVVSKFVIDLLGADNDIKLRFLINELVAKVTKYNSASNNSSNTHVFNKIYQSVKEIQKYSNEMYLTTRINNYFSLLFHDQIVNFNSNEAKVKLNIKGAEFSVRYSNNICKYTANFLLTNKAIFIDSPQSLDLYSDYSRNYFYQDSEFNSNILSNILPQDFIARLMSENLHNSAEDDVVGKTISEQKTKNVMNVIGKAISGTFEDDSGVEGFKFSDSNSTVILDNLSSGVKSFLIIRKLLENGQISERDVLILDEPEINLHPAWQLVFAELIVILQKEYDLTVLLSTHSPYFLNALDVYASKYDVHSKCKFYSVDSSDSLSSTINDVTDNIEVIYKKLAKPFQDLEKETQIPDKE